MKRFTVLCIFLFVFFFLALAAIFFFPKKLFAATSASTLHVYGNMNSSCNFGTTSTPVTNYTLSFGSVPGIGTTAVGANSTISLFCTIGGAVQVAMGPGQIGAMGPAVNGVTNSREMLNGITPMAYNLYLDSGHKQVWGDGTAATLGAFPQYVIVNNNSSASATVYGLIPVQTVPVTSGSYSDTVTMTATF